MKISFATITVANLEESIKFYTEILNLKVITRFSPHKGVNIAFLKDDEGGKVELIENEGQSSEKRQSQVSLGFSVENIDETVEMLKAKNINILRGPVVTPGGPKFIFIEDPNGVEIEFIEGFNM